MHKFNEYVDCDMVGILYAEGESFFRHMIFFDFLVVTNIKFVDRL